MRGPTQTILVLNQVTLEWEPYWKVGEKLQPVGLCGFVDGQLLISVSEETDGDVALQLESILYPEYTSREIARGIKVLVLRAIALLKEVGALEIKGD